MAGRARRESARRVSDCVTALLRDQPFFGSLALRLPIRADAARETLASDGREIRYAPDWVANTDAGLIKTAIGRVVLACALKHHTRRGMRDPERWQQASQLVTHGLLRDAGFKLPPDAEAWDGISVEQAYDRLPESQEGEGDGSDGSSSAGGGGDAGDPQPGTGDDNDPGDGDDANSTDHASGDGDPQAQDGPGGNGDSDTPTSCDPSGTGEVILRCPPRGLRPVRRIRRDRGRGPRCRAGADPWAGRRGWTGADLGPRAAGPGSGAPRWGGPAASRIVWSIGDSVDRDGWTSERVETIGRLLPHLRQFVRVRHALLRTGSLGASLAELLDSVRAGVIQLDRRARPVAANDRARALLRRGDGLRDEDGLLRAVLPGEDAALQGLIARALPFAGGPGEGGSMLLSRPQTRSRLVVHVSPVHDAGIESGRGGVGALVLAVDPADRAGIDPARVGKALGLTPAESRVAVSLAEGRTIDDIATGTGRSRTTVKWHIRHIYAELGVSRPIELAQLIASLSDVPGARG